MILDQRQMERLVNAVANTMLADVQLRFMSTEQMACLYERHLSAYPAWRREGEQNKPLWEYRAWREGHGEIFFWVPADSAGVEISLPGKFMEFRERFPVFIAKEFRRGAEYFSSSPETIPWSWWICKGQFQALLHEATLRELNNITFETGYYRQCAGRPQVTHILQNGKPVCGRKFKGQPIVFEQGINWSRIDCAKCREANARRAKTRKVSFNGV